MTASFHPGLPNLTPLVLRALWQTGQLYPEQAPAWATELLAGGADSPALRQLAGLHRPTRTEVEPVVDRALTELGAPPLDDDATWRIAAREIASGAVEGRIAPNDAAASLSGLWSDYDWPRELGSFPGLGDEWGMHPACRAEIEAEIVAACGQVLEEVDVDP